MTLKRGLWTFGLLTALTVIGGCGREENPVPGQAQSPTGTSSATNPSTSAAGPATAPGTRLVGTIEDDPSSAGSPVSPNGLALAPGGAGAAAPAAAPSAAGTPSTQPISSAKTASPAEAAKADPSKVPQTARVPGWYQWRGPEQNGVSREKNLPEKWNPETGENVIWTADVGGMSSPVIWNGKLYTWTRVGEVKAGAADNPTLVPGPLTQEALVCVDLSNGKVLWTHVNNMTQTEVPFHRLGWSSPCVDPSTGRVYAMGSQAWFLCLEGDTGKVVWNRQMTEEFGMISTFGGRTPAPMVDEDNVFLAGVAFGWGDHARSQHRLFAFNKNTGELRWSNGTGGIPVDAPQNTPVIAVVKGQRLVIFAAGDGGIHAFQPRTGKKVWTAKVSKRGLNTSVVVDGERLYCSHGLDNYDTNALGRIFCLDIGTIENGSPKEVWAIKGVEAAFPTPVAAGDRVYVIDDRANVHAIDKETGKTAWKYDCGGVGKASPVYADGKLYVADGDGMFTILKPGAKRTDTKVLSRVRLTEKLGREYVIYGSPAIADGRLYIQAATKLYCIGNKDAVAAAGGNTGAAVAAAAGGAKAEADPIPPLPEEKPAEEKAAHVQVVPADAALHAGQQVKFTVRMFDANGRFLKEVPGDQAKFAVAQLTIPAPPPRPAMPGPANTPAAAPAAEPAGGGTAAAGDAPKAGGAGETPAAPATPAAPGAADSADAARAALATATTQPAAGPTQAGNLQGDIAADGTFTSKPGPQHQGGAIEATVDGVTGQARVRVFPALPWKFDFEQAPVGKPPLTWLGAGGKYAVVDDPDDANNKVLQKLYDIDLYYRARTNFGMESMADYTVQADTKVHEKVAAERRYVPTAAVLNSRYVLALEGMGQKLQIHIWPSALPDERNPNGAQHQTIDFPFDAKKWYRLKLQVTQEKDKAVARGKAWPVGSEEPKDWMLTLEDPIPNRNGNPGLFSVSLVGQFKSEVYYDNILVTPNTPAGAPAAAATATPAGGAGAGDLNK